MKEKEETLQEIADRLKNFKGNCKGEIFRMHVEYIKQKEGEEGLKKLKEKLKELDFPLDIEKVKSFQWVSEGLSAIVIVTCKEIFNWTDEDVFEMGYFAPKFSFVLKIMAQYLISIETLFKNAEKYWYKNYDFGKMETLKFDKEKQQIIVREKEIKTHPLVCIYHAGYFKGLCEFVLKNKKITVEETACMHKGSDYHEFLIKWE